MPTERALITNDDAKPTGNSNESPKRTELDVPDLYNTETEHDDKPLELKFSK